MPSYYFVTFSDSFLFHANPTLFPYRTFQEPIQLSTLLVHAIDVYISNESKSTLLFLNPPFIDVEKSSEFSWIEMCVRTGTYYGEMHSDNRMKHKRPWGRLGTKRCGHLLRSTTKWSEAVNGVRGTMEVVRCGTVCCTYYSPNSVSNLTSMKQLIFFPLYCFITIAATANIVAFSVPKILLFFILDEICLSDNQ